MRVVGIVAPFDPRGSVPGKNSFYRVPMGKWAQHSVSPSAICHGRASIRGKSFYRETWVQDDGGRHLAKHSSDPRVAYPEVKVQVRNLVRVWVLLPALPHGLSVPGENSFY